MRMTMRTLPLVLVSFLLQASAIAKAFPTPSSAKATTTRGATTGWTKTRNNKPLQQVQHPRQLRAKSLHQPTVTKKLSRNSPPLQAVGGDGSGGVLSLFSSIGSFYAHSLAYHPVVTKSVTASLSFGLADFLAQKFTKSEGQALDATRITFAMLIGLLYYGPANHYWYEMIFKVFPGTNIGSTLIKATVGQLSFSPGFTCVFFASTLIQSGKWSVGNWIRKISNDLPAAWIAGISFWPFMDIIAYSYIRKDYIPLFNTVCAFAWTIYLSLVSNKRRQTA